MPEITWSGTGVHQRGAKAASKQGRPGDAGLHSLALLANPPGLP
jgi:hypothetical protein